MRNGLSEGDEGRGALLSDDGIYRYRLWRHWDQSAPVMAWVMLNPSTADANLEDSTLRKCLGFAKAHGHGGVILVNLFAWRARKPSDLRLASDPIGPENDSHILWACEAPRLATVVAAWGGNPFARWRALHVSELIRSAGISLKCLGTTNNGHPKHPVYLPYSSAMRPFLQKA